MYTFSQKYRVAAPSGGREPANVSPRWAQPPEKFAAFFSSRRTLARGVVAVGCSGVMFACGSEAALPGRNTVAVGSNDGESSETLENTDAAPSAEAAPGDRAEAPGISGGQYPPPPYGTQQGAVIENLEFFGWSNPVVSEFDVEQGTTVRLSDFYNAGGAPGEGTEYILLNAVAAWCGVCRTEYQDLETKGTYGELAARGVEMVGVLFEDNNGDPSTYQDMINWARAYSVAFPFVNDPAFRSGVYFDKSATPMNMLIDARTMQIVLVMTGYNPLIYTQVDKLLQERGR